MQRLRFYYCNQHKICLAFILDISLFLLHRVQEIIIFTFSGENIYLSLYKIMKCNYCFMKLQGIPWKIVLKVLYISLAQFPCVFWCLFHFYSTRHVVFNSFPRQRFSPRKENNTGRDYNWLHPGWSPNSADDSGCSFTDINTGEFCSQYVAILEYKLGSAEPFWGHCRVYTMAKSMSRWSFPHRRSGTLIGFFCCLWIHFFLRSFIKL